MKKIYIPTCYYYQIYDHDQTFKNKNNLPDFLGQTHKGWYAIADSPEEIAARRPFEGEEKVMSIREKQLQNLAATIEAIDTLTDEHITITIRAKDKNGKMYSCFISTPLNGREPGETIILPFNNHKIKSLIISDEPNLEQDTTSPYAVGVLNDKI
jgi:hypothetical protein